jgi:gliding motility-associated lipoprotein GldD
LKKALALILALSFWGCKEDAPTPKPVGYFRIDLPESDYKRRNPEYCPFSITISSHSRIEYAFHETNPECWFNVYYPRFDATIYFTYKEVKDNLRAYIEESRAMTYEHQIKANRIEAEAITYPEKNVYGLIYDLGGNVASPVQFYLTDSTDHFLRGSLYFNARPNPDSIKPVLGFVRTDIDSIINGLQWAP